MLLFCAEDLWGFAAEPLYDPRRPQPAASFNGLGYKVVGFRV